MPQNAGGDKYAKIQRMDALPSRPTHESYQRHRREVVTQIILPTVLAVLLCMVAGGLVTFATFKWSGDVNRWAAISTIWIVIPIMVGSLIFLAVLVGINYLLVRLLGITPRYTKIAQDFVQMLSLRIRQAADASVQPVMVLDEIGATIKRFFGIK